MIARYLSGHVLYNRDPTVEVGLLGGVSCIRCRGRFVAFLWPREGIMFECRCPCACHSVEPEPMVIAKLPMPSPVGVPMPPPPIRQAPGERWVHSLR